MTLLIVIVVIIASCRPISPHYRSCPSVCLSETELAWLAAVCHLLPGWFGIAKVGYSS